MLPRKETNYIMTNLSQTAPLKLIQKNEIILKIAVYHPEKNIKTQEFLVLGSQKLTELRDKLYCLAYHMPYSKEIKSGYFFIENTFYNDMRNDTSIDYSQTVIQWHKDNGITNADSLSSQKMEDVRFNDLYLRIGQKYMYCHQGSCKHFIRFIEVRLLNDIDKPNYNLYPLQIFQSKVRRRKCTICQIAHSKWLTYNDKYSLEDPSFYCDQCFKQLHYSKDGSLIYSDFEVYSYQHE